MRHAENLEAMDPKLALDRADVFEEVLRERRSVRGFHSQPVPRPVLERIFAMAQATPSNCNVQPWFTHVVSGAAAERMRRTLSDAAERNEPSSSDVPLTGGYAGEYKARQVDAAKALFAATGVERHDMEARRASYLRNFRFFDAPHAAFVYLPSWTDLRAAADCGMYAQSLMLAMTACGVASCPQGALSHYAAAVREALGLEPGPRLLFGIAFGYEDLDHPTRSVRPDRLALREAVRFHD